MEQLNSGRLYIDEDPDQQLALLLTPIRHDTALTSQLGNKGRTDVWQLAFAAREQRALITGNIRYSSYDTTWKLTSCSCSR